MKIFHLSDLHLGKKVNEMNMIEDQAYILQEILQQAEREKPDCVVIAGDLYDKQVPGTEAVMLCDKFLTKLSARNIPVFIISGNHDSAERVAFGTSLLEKSGIFISPVYNGSIAPVKLQDEYGIVNFYLIPFLKPANVKRFFKEEINSYTEAMQAVVDHMEINQEERNIAVVHQFLTGAVKSESEEICIGGVDNIDASVFQPFDYVALGHLHRPQKAGQEWIRYCGTPLKYSFSETGDQKSITRIMLGEKGTMDIDTIPLVPQRDMEEITGTYEKIADRSYYQEKNLDNYFHITLTDEEDIPEALGKLRTIYPKIMKLDYDNKRTREHRKIENQTVIQKTPLQYLEEFYELQNNQPMNEEQKKLSISIMESIWEG